MPYLWLKLLKLLAVCLFAAGVGGAFLPSALLERQRAVFGLALPGFLASWTLGFWLAYELHTSLFATWILSALATSFFGLNVLAWAVAVEGRRSLTAAVLAVSAFVGTVALMVLKPA